jgi:uncharacterized protein YndB with AHSA1/START domain
MGTIRHSIWIDAAPEVVWDVFTDLDNIPEWQTGHPRVGEVTGPGDVVGTTYTVRRGPGASHSVVTQAERPVRYASRTSAYLGLRFDLTADLVPQDGGTRLDLVAQTYWPRGLGNKEPAWPVEVHLHGEFFGPPQPGRAAPATWTIWTTEKETRGDRLAPHSFASGPQSNRRRWPSCARWRGASGRSARVGCRGNGPSREPLLRPQDAEWTEHPEPIVRPRAG